MIEIRTHKYEKAYGHKPRGRDRWAIQIDCPTPAWFKGAWRNVKRRAIAHARDEKRPTLWFWQRSYCHNTRYRFRSRDALRVLVPNTRSRAGCAAPARSGCAQSRVRAAWRAKHVVPLRSTNWESIIGGTERSAVWLVSYSKLPTRPKRGPI